MPALYLVANGAIALAMLRGRPLECAIALAVTATGLPFYFWFVAHRADATAAGACWLGTRSGPSRAKPAIGVPACDRPILLPSRAPDG